MAGKGPKNAQQATKVYNHLVNGQKPTKTTKKSKGKSKS